MVPYGDSQAAIPNTQKKMLEMQQESEVILSAFGNKIKRLVIFYLGTKGKAKGGANDFIMPLIEMANGMGIELNPFSVPPKLSELKNHDKMLKQDNEGYWNLTDLGKKSYRIMQFLMKNWDDFSKD